MPWVDTNSIQTYYESHGEGPSIIFVNGGVTTLSMWDPQVDYFSPCYRIITYDLRGHGKSEGSENQYSCDLFARDLKVLLDHLDISNPVICGLSLGGMIAQRYAVKYPKTVAGLVLADTSASTTLTFADRLQTVLPSKILVKFLLRLLSKKQYVRLAFSFYPKMQPVVKAQLMRDALQYKKKELIKLVDAIYNFPLQDLARIQAPTLILLGEWEPRLVYTHAKILQRLIKCSEIRVIPQAQHVSNLENPKAFNQLLESFLSKNRYT